MSRQVTNEDDAAVLALGALGWVVGDPARADRFLSLTGMAPGDLRQRASDPAFLVHVLTYLEAHEPDLVACAQSLDVAPAALVAARITLENA